ncbi:MAG: hypothetical protein OXT09_22965 [Myxococcales bacterium]|nr:hypothetical protein [Myxococcales bacterium]
MTLEVIGAGFPRTGTFSMRKALGALGLAPSYHMQEVFLNAEHPALWRAAAARELDNWESLFAGYRSIAGDGPACLFWRELVEHYPQAKVVLTLRDGADWYESFRSTVLHTLVDPERIARSDSDLAALQMARELVLDGVFGGRFDDAGDAIARYEAHNRAVQEGVPADRLLVYRMGDGWAPLCAHLGTPVPDLPFPRTNDRASIRQRLGLSP